MGTPKTVLVVENDHDTRVCLRQGLEESGYFVVSAGSGTAALELLGNMTKPSFIILDTNMPIMSGAQFIEVIRAKDEFKSIPVVQISTGNSSRLPDICCAFEKPLDMRHVVETIRGCKVLENT